MVSDNDGSAFITKAEFDSLKNNFQSQLDSYNTAIDNKIDAAIATYLAGIKQEAQTTTNIINNTWGECTVVNGVFGNSYQIPNIDFMFILNYYHKVNKTSKSYDGADVESATAGTAEALYNEYEGNLGHVMRLQHTLNWSGKFAYRNLVSCTGDDVNYGNLIWSGRALKYNETINLVKHVATWLGSSSAIQWLGYFDRPDSRSYTCTIRNVSTFKKNGKISSWKSEANTAWPISYIWKSNSDYTANVTWSTEKEQNMIIGTIDLLPDDNGNIIDYEHIMSYRTDSAWRVSDASFTKRYRLAPDNAIKSSNLYSASTVTNTAKGFSTAWFQLYNGGSGKIRDQWPIFWGLLPVNHEITDDSTISSIGMLDSDVRADGIYQDNNIRTITTNKATFTKNPPTLEQGLQLLVNKKDAKITWEPTFNYTHVHNGASTYTDNTHEVDIYFSLTPFGDKVSNTGNLIQVKVNGSTEKKNFATTVNRRCKVEFEMPEDGLVYVKWVPHETTYIDSDWLVTLDVKSCSTYIYQSNI